MSSCRFLLREDGVRLRNMEWKIRENVETTLGVVQKKIIFTYTWGHENDFSRLSQDFGKQ